MKYSISYHTIADDMQLYMRVLLHDYSLLQSLSECIQQINKNASLEVSAQMDSEKD